MPRSKKLSGPISIRLDPDVRAAIEHLAEADGRSVSDYINRALRAHAEALRWLAPTHSKKPKAKG